MVKLAGCLQDEIVASGLPQPCFIGVVEGDSAALDCDSCGGGACGAAWVRLSSAFPSQSFPIQDSVATCATRLAFVLEVGITRCFSPFADEYGRQPSIEDHMNATRLQMADMSAMRRAIACCLGDEEYEDIDYILGQYTPVPFMGGCGGGTWELTIAQRDRPNG